MSASQRVIEVSEANFETEVIARSHHAPVVVDFWAPWCGPCRMLGPILEKLAREADGAWTLVKINTDENQRLAMRFGIQGIPAVKAFRDGKIVAEFTGAQPEPAVRQFLQKLLPAAGPGSSAGLEAAEKLLTGQRWPEAEAAFRRAAASANASPAAALGLARALLGQGKGAEAERILNGIASGPEVAVVEKLRPLARFLGDAQTYRNGPQAEGLESDFYDAGRQIAQGDLTGALEGLLGVLRRDKRFRNGEPRLVMLGIFELLGDQDPMTREYRQKLALVLY